MSGRKKELLDALNEAVKELRFLGMETDEIVKYISEGRNEK